MPCLAALPPADSAASRAFCRARAFAACLPLDFHLPCLAALGFGCHCPPCWTGLPAWTSLTLADTGPWFTNAEGSATRAVLNLGPYQRALPPCWPWMLAAAAMPCLLGALDFHALPFRGRIGALRALPTRAGAFGRHFGFARAPGLRALDSAWMPAAASHCLAPLAAVCLPAACLLPGFAFSLLCCCAWLPAFAAFNACRSRSSCLLPCRA